MKNWSKVCIIFVTLMFVAADSYAGRRRTPRMARNTQKAVRVEKPQQQKGGSFYHNPNRPRRNDEPRMVQGARPNNVPGLYIGNEKPKHVQKSNSTVTKSSDMAVNPFVQKENQKSYLDLKKKMEKKKPVPFYMQKGSTADYSSFGKNTKKYYEYE